MAASRFPLEAVTKAPGETTTRTRGEWNAATRASTHRDGRAERGTPTARMHRDQIELRPCVCQHVWRVYGFLAYRLGDRDTAEDLTQATFERALRAWSRFDPRRASESTWLLAIARNLLIDHYRRDRSNLTEPIEDHLAPVVPGPEEQLALSRSWSRRWRG